MGSDLLGNGKEQPEIFDFQGKVEYPVEWLRVLNKAEKSVAYFKVCDLSE